MADSHSFGDAGDKSSEEEMEPARSFDAKATVLATGSVAAALAGSALVFAFVSRPPALAWVGFAVVSATVLGLAALVPLAFERTRVSALPHADAVDREQRLLVIADSHCSERGVCNEIVAGLADAVAVHLVVP